jgi:hypothetical protein
MDSYGSFHCVDSLIAGPEETKNHSGEEVLRLIQIRLAPPSLEKSQLIVKTIPSKYDSAVSSRNDVSCSLARTQRTAFCVAVRVSNEHCSPHDAVSRVYNDAGNVIETHERAGDFRELRVQATARVLKLFRWPTEKRR